MEADKPPCDQGCSQGSHQSNSALGSNPNQAPFPQSPSVASSEAITQQPSSETEDDTMKITPVKAVVVRKHSKQLPRASFRRKSNGDYDESALGLSKLKQSSGTAPLCSSLPDDLICKVTSFLDVISLMQIRKCNRHLSNLIARNEAGWEHLCQRLWAKKVHVPPIPSTLTPHYFMEAYHSSIRDAHHRQHLTRDELCYDPEHHTGTIWSFRFKESAGADWTTSDPWHNGSGPPRKMVFLKDGSVRQYIPASNNKTSPVRRSSSPASTPRASDTSDSESSLPELIGPNFGNDFSDNNNNNPQPPSQQQQQQPNGRLIPPPLNMSWRFLTRPMDLPTRPIGSYLRLSVGGREVPTYSVRRSPTGNWGFVMESCWGLYASFELPPKQQRASAARERRRLRRTETGARWVEVWESGEETLQHGNAPDDATLMDDASLVITNEIQWREAFLYNVGARVLPEGDNATDDFDRAFRGMP